jgi:hypothetical protein
MHAQALEAFRTLASRTEDPKWQAAVDREKSVLFQQVVP